MRRRDFPSAALVAPAVFRSVPATAAAPWRTFEITTRLERRRDSLDPERFRYAITAREL